MILRRLFEPWELAIEFLCLPREGRRSADFISSSLLYEEWRSLRVRYDFEFEEDLRGGSFSDLSRGLS